VTDVRFAPIGRRTVAVEVREAIIERIRAGELPPGQQLPAEREMCEQFGVARTSVREAVQGLIMLGVLEKRGNRSYVAEHLPNISLNGGDGRKRRVRDLFELRQVVEVPIARLAAFRATSAQREEIARISEGFRPDMPLLEFREQDRLFHSAVASACGNPALAELYAKVLESLFESTDFEQMLWADSNRRAVREVIRGAVKAHQEIARAIASEDGDAVQAAAEHHLAQVEDQMVSRMV
jgi:DNA-binding FadR family transcriptional regulator